LSLRQLLLDAWLFEANNVDKKQVGEDEIDFDFSDIKKDDIISLLS